MTNSPFTMRFGPFARAREDTDAFCHNLFLSYAMSQCVEKMIQLEHEYKDALLRDDEEVIEQKRLALQTYQSSLQFTACMLDEVDKVST